MKRDYAETPIYPNKSKHTTIRCSACNTPLAEQDLVCPECGTTRPAKMRDRLETK